MAENSKSDFKVKGDELLSKIKQIIKEGNARKIIIKSDKGKKLLEIPVSVGIVGIVLLPFYAAIAGLAAMAINFSIEIVKKEDTVK